MYSLWSLRNGSQILMRAYERPMTFPELSVPEPSVNWNGPAGLHSQGPSRAEPTSNSEDGMLSLASSKLSVSCSERHTTLFGRKNFESFREVC